MVLQKKGGGACEVLAIVKGAPKFPFIKLRGGGEKF